MLFQLVPPILSLRIFLDLSLFSQDLLYLSQLYLVLG